MNTELANSDPSPIELIHDPELAAALLKPPRLALLEALRQPHSAAGLARRLDLPRQRLNHHLRELERLGLVVLHEERRRGNFTERILRATAQRYLICPEVLGDLGSFGPQALRDPHAWTSLAAMAAQTLSHLAVLRSVAGADPPTLTVPSLLRFTSTETLDAFTLELTEELGRLVRKYHDESGTSYWFMLGAYPAISEVPSAARGTDRQGRFQRSD